MRDPRVCDIALLYSGASVCDEGLGFKTNRSLQFLEDIVPEVIEPIGGDAPILFLKDPRNYLKEFDETHTFDVVDCDEDLLTLCMFKLNEAQKGGVIKFKEYKY